MGDIWSYFNGDDKPIYKDPANKVVPWHDMVNATHSAVSAISRAAQSVVQKVTSLNPRDQPFEGGPVKPGSQMDKQAKAQGINTAPTAGRKDMGAIAGAAGAAIGNKLGGAMTAPSSPHTPVSHPGAGPTKTPMKAIGAVNGGHATTHPATPPAGHGAARTPKPQHATSKATGGTQTHKSSGPAAGHPAAKKPKTKIGSAVHGALHKHKKKKTHVKKPKKTSTKKS